MTFAPGLPALDGSHPDRLARPRRVLLFLAILLSGGNILIPREVLALLVLFMAIGYFGFANWTVNKRKVLAYGWLALVMVLALARLQDADLRANLIRFTNFLIAFALLQIYWAGGAKLKGDLVVLIRPMVYQAILTVALALVLPPLFIPITIGEADLYTFLGILNFHSIREGSVRLVRPNGFFVEPGVFQIYLNILMFLLLASRVRLRRILPVILAIVLTQSTTGLIIAAMQLLYFSTAPLFARKFGMKGVLRIAVIAVLAIPVGFFLESNIEAKLFGEQSASANARQYDLISGLLVIQANPLIGIGFNHDAYLSSSFSLNPDTDLLAAENKEGRNNTNGILIALYSVGLPLGLIYLLAMFRQALIPHRTLFAVILLLSLGTEPLSFTPLFAFFAFSGLCLGRRHPKQQAAPALESMAPRY
ncbi:MAG: hypothetical protein JNJ60_02455 [Rhodocyclaceae bacterium]|nr:hypothetical protein [Rhodocyclaceae bacterium]